MKLASHWYSKDDREYEKTYEDYQYLNIRFKITGEQFKNLIGFLTVILNEDVMKLATMSPDYIVEKFQRFLGDPSKIINEDVSEFGGIHAILRRDFLTKYYKIWGHADGWEFMAESEINTNNLIDDN